MTQDKSLWNERLELYDKLVAQCSRFDRKGKSMPYTSENGYMFSMINKDSEVGIRFSEEVKEKYLSEFKTTIFKNHNAIIKGYILIPADLLKDEKRLVELLNESYEYVMSLKKVIHGAESRLCRFCKRSIERSRKFRTKTNVWWNWLFSRSNHVCPFE
jgi:hypothetical protein